jgi:hypothetical protein
MTAPPEPRDINGLVVAVGSRVRLLSLSGAWVKELPDDERQDVLSMIGEVLRLKKLTSTAVRGFESPGPMKLKELVTAIPLHCIQRRWSLSVSVQPNPAFKRTDTGGADLWVFLTLRAPAPSA